MISVYLNDSGIAYEKAEQHFLNAANWAQEQCSSFLGYDVQDVSDVSLQNDLIAQYNFQLPKDAEWFTLKWK
jgi:hypothetical protein